MIRIVFACFNGKASHKEAKVAPLQEAEAACRDELTKSKRQTPRKAVVKKRVRFVDSEPTILGEDHSEKEIIEKSCADNEFRENKGFRVTVRMAKEEAARLLSKCNDGVLDLKDVACELVSMPLSRVSVISACSNNL